MHSLPTHVGIAWKLVSDFNQIDSLFKAQELPYKVITHVCSCKAVHVKIVPQDNWWLIDTMQILDAIIENGDYDTLEEHIQAIPKAKKYSCIGIHNLLLTHLRKIIADKNVNLIFTYSAKTIEHGI